MSSFIQNITVFTKDFENHKTYFKPLISGKDNFLNHLNRFEDLSQFLFWFVLGLLVDFSL